MFLIRLAFWIGLAVLLMPTDERQQARLYGTVVAAVESVTTFCDRNAQVCTDGAEIWATVVKKAEFGARLATDLASTAGRKPSATEAEPLPQPASYRSRPDARLTPPPSPVPVARNTLTPADLSPVWRGGMQRAGG
jgi:Family of unknown function (DUF5330)